MATATLLKHRRLNVGGVVFERGEETPVELSLARALQGDRRFDVDLGGESGSTVRVKTVAAQIREAAEGLDPEKDKGKFLRDGRPSSAAISKIIDQKVTQYQVDNALGLKPLPAKVELKPKEAEAEKPKGKLVVKSKSTEPKAVETKDPSTEGAVGV